MCGLSLLVFAVLWSPVRLFPIYTYSRAEGGHCRWNGLQIKNDFEFDFKIITVYVL